MWSNDFPPRQLHLAALAGRWWRGIWGHLPEDVRAKLLRDNVARLYNMPVPAAMAVEV